MHKRSKNQHMMSLDSIARKDPFKGRQRELQALGPLVYAVLTDDQYIKIGYTANLGARIKFYGSTATLLAVRLGCTLADEVEIHGRLARHVGRGREYYPITSPALDVVNELRSEMGMGTLTPNDLLDMSQAA